MINISYCYSFNMLLGTGYWVPGTGCPALIFLVPGTPSPFLPFSPPYPLLLGNTILNLVPVGPLAGSLFDSAVICPLCIFTTP
jgi:hypothetical protein